MILQGHNLLRKNFHFPLFAIYAFCCGKMYPVFSPNFHSSAPPREPVFAVFGSGSRPPRFTPREPLFWSVSNSPRPRLCFP
jgi:hypothetical protein